MPLEVIECINDNPLSASHSCANLLTANLASDSCSTCFELDDDIEIRKSASAMGDVVMCSDIGV